MMLEGKQEEKQVCLRGVKARFVQKFPQSQTASLLSSLPNSMNAEELIGAVGVLLDQLDRERAKKLADRISNEEVV